MNLKKISGITVIMHAKRERRGGANLLLKRDKRCREPDLYY